MSNAAKNANAAATQHVDSAALVEHLPLVNRIVAQFVRRLPRSVQREDLVSAGTFGLFQALRTSGHIATSCPEMFASYARIRIRGSIVDELRRHDWSPRRRRSEANKGSEMQSVDAAALGTPANDTAGASPSARPSQDASPPSVRERAPVCVIGFDDLAPQALGNFLFESSTGAVEGTTSGWGTRSPLDQLEEKVTSAKLHACLASLPPREGAIIRMRYFEGLASKAIATALGLSEARISQLHTRATARLHELLEAQESELGQAA